MRWRNDARGYGGVAVLLHWGMALVVCALFGLGLWMSGLDYYHSWYRAAPALHKGSGVLLFLVLLARLGWRMYSPPPAPLPNHASWERRLAHGAHAGLYLLLLAVMASGYLISTADGRGIEVFGLFTVPAILTALPRQEDVAGAAHLALAIGLIGLAALHALAALKHHFIDHDRTLLRMLGR